MAILSGVEIASSSEAQTPRNDIGNILTIEAVSDYKNYLVESNLPIKTINRRLSTLRKFCTFCINQNWMKENVAKKVGNVGSTHERRDGACPVSTEKIEPDTNKNKHDILSEFKQYLLSEQAKQNVETGHAPSLLVVDDVHEFLSICHPA